MQLSERRHFDGGLMIESDMAFVGIVDGDAEVTSNVICELRGIVEGDLIIHPEATVMLSGIVNGDISNHGNLSISGIVRGSVFGIGDVELSQQAIVLGIIEA